MKSHIITGVILLVLLKAATINVGKNGTKGVVYKSGKKIASIVGHQVVRESEKAVEKKTKSVFRASFQRQIVKSIRKDQVSLGKIVPYGNGGINKEKRTLREICTHPIPQKLLKETESLGIAPTTLSKIKKDLSKMGSKIIPEPSQNGHVNLSTLAWPGINPPLPNKENLIKAIMNNRKGMKIEDIGPDDIRKVSYDIAYQALANKYNITKEQASLLIGKLDMVIHESESGVVEIVPNNVHRFKQLYAHKGYVSKMMKEISGKDILEE